MICYNITILPFRNFVCDLVLYWCVLHTPDLTSPDMTGYTLDSMADVWPHHLSCSPICGRLFTHLGFPKWPCCLECNIYSRIRHVNGLMIFDKWMTDGRLFPSSYFIYYYRRIEDTQTVKCLPTISYLDKNKHKIL